MSKPAVLVYEKNSHRATNLRRVIEAAGYSVVTVFSPVEAEKVFLARRFDLLIAGFDAFPLPPSLEGGKIIISAPDGRYRETDRLARSYHAQCVTYPYDEKLVRERIERTLVQAGPADSAALPSEADTGIIGDSESIRSVVRTVVAAANVSSAVLITGETGTGKELCARALHRLGPRKNGPFVAVNCGAMAESLLESELFGHEKGSFTGAHKRHAGKFETADGGTLFLDEVGDMPHALQVKLLRVLETGTFCRVGGEASLTVDVRLICATNRDLVRLAGSGAFRHDLLYRINVLGIRLPPLREREEDIPLMAAHFARQLAGKFGKRCRGFLPDAMKKMVRHRWPGNVRELHNAVERAMVRLSGDLIEEVDFGQATPPSPLPPPSLASVLDSGFSEMQAAVLAHYEKEYLKAVLAQTRGSIRDTCARCGIDRKTLYLKMKTYGLDKKDFK